MAGNEWTDELKQEVIAAYEEKSPTAETSINIVKNIAAQFEKTANGVRMILSKAGVYIKTTPATTTSTGKSTEGSKRINKGEAIAALKAKILALEQEADDDILNRLTGKAAAYMLGILDNSTPG